MNQRLLFPAGISLLWLVMAGVVGQETPRSGSGAPQSDPIFSGPQVGEKLPPFSLRLVLGPRAGQEVDLVTEAAGKPLVLVFVHDVNRQSISFTRFLTAYTMTREAEGLRTGVVWLDDDASAAEAMVKRVQHALTATAPTGVSPDGREGPGSYGLNRQVTLTILVAKEGKVTANFALIQPSLQADLPRVLTAIVQVAGGKVPRLEELPGAAEMLRPATAMKGKEGADRRGQPDPALLDELRSLIRPLIRRDATPEAVDQAAVAIEEYVRTREAARREVARIATTIVTSGKLENYGTARAQEYLRKWAKQAESPKEKSPEKSPPQN